MSVPAVRAGLWSLPVYELLGMFCALNGATRIPRRAGNRHSPM